MPIIKSSAELRNNYNSISSLCHEYNEPVFITKNGKGDIVTLSIEKYEELVSKYELYKDIELGLNEISKGNTKLFSQAIDEIKARRK